MEIGKAVDLRGVVPGGAGWEAARDAVTASMVAHGCVVVKHDAPSVDLRQALFTRILPELFALPLEVKKRTVGYFGQIPAPFPPLKENQCPRLTTNIDRDEVLHCSPAWESLGVNEPTDPTSVRGFAEMHWPEGNPEFCETIVSFAKNMKRLEEMVETLVLEGLGVRQESIRAHFDLIDHGLRFSYYGVPLETHNNITLKPHCDSIMVTGIMQHEVEGLEVHDGDGWVTIPLETDTFTFVAGESFKVLTNGRVPACVHRVRTPSNRERFSVLFYRRQYDGIKVHVLEELVDAEHPLVYNPLCHEEYSKWRITKEGRKFGDPLKAYCGVDKVVEAMS